MHKTSLSEAPRIPFDFEGYKMHSSQTAEIIHLKLRLGEHIPQHPNASDVVACLVEGHVTLDMGDNQTPLALYDVVEIEKGAARGFTNTGDSDARLLIFKKL